MIIVICKKCKTNRKVTTKYWHLMVVEVPCYLFGLHLVSVLAYFRISDVQLSSLESQMPTLPWQTPRKLPKNYQETHKAANRKSFRNINENPALLYDDH